MGEFLRTQVAVDGHVHFREPGTNTSETIASGTEAAAFGGVGVTVDMSNNPGRATYDLERVMEKRALGREGAAVHLGVTLGIQPEFNNVREIESTRDYTSQYKAYGGPTTGVERTTDYEAYEFDEGLDGIKKYDPGKLVVFHSGKDNYRDFIGHAAGDRGLRVRLAHVNRMDQVEAVLEALERGWDVRSAVCPHTLLLTSRDTQTRSSFADMQPVLVGQSESDELFDALVNYKIHELETDHAPHPYENKMAAAIANPTCSEADHSTRCCGVPGIDLAMPLMLWQVHIGRISLERLMEVYSSVPADSLGLKFREDSYVEWDMEPYRIDEEMDHVRSQAGWTPYLGMMAMGNVRQMRVGGIDVINNYHIQTRARSVLGKGNTLI